MNYLGIIMSDKLNIRIGYLHTPKCAGSSLNKSIFEVLGLQPFHIVKVCSTHNTDAITHPSRLLIEGSLAFTLACNMPYVPGHITYSELKKLKRDFIFTVLRDPRKRIISLFTYMVKRANSERVVRAFPKMKRYAGMGFFEYMNYRKLENEPPNLLLRDIDESGFISQEQDWENPSHELIEIVENSLLRLDAVYACSNQEVLDDLHLRGLIPQAKEVWVNESDKYVDFGSLGSRQVFLEMLSRETWQEVMIYKAAQRLFPDTVRTHLASDEEILLYVEHRFGASFAD